LCNCNSQFYNMKSVHKKKENTSSFMWSCYLRSLGIDLCYLHLHYNVDQVIQMTFLRTVNYTLSNNQVEQNPSWELNGFSHKIKDFFIYKGCWKNAFILYISYRHFFTFSVSVCHLCPLSYGQSPKFRQIAKGTWLLLTGRCKF